MDALVTHIVARVGAFKEVTGKRLDHQLPSTHASTTSHSLLSGRSRGPDRTLLGARL
jgi:hypothetical protein